MAKKNTEPGIALPGQLEGPDAHFSTDKTVNPVPVPESTPGSYPKWLYPKKGVEGSALIVDSPEEHAVYAETHGEAPAVEESGE